LTQQTEQSLKELANDQLFGPLGIKKFAWSQDTEGAEWGGFGLQLTARDLAKFGQLYLNDGIWEKQEIISPVWIEQSTQKQIAATNSDYSLQWWISRTSETPIYFGHGYGGQLLFLIPENNLLVIGLHEYFVSNEQSNQQSSNFIEQVFNPIFQALD